MQTRFVLRKPVESTAVNPPNSGAEAIIEATRQAHKDYAFDDRHNPNRPALVFFQQTPDGDALFVVFYTQACRWSRCTGCNLPSAMSARHIGFIPLMAQVDNLFRQPDIRRRAPDLRKVIVSNNGSVLDQQTFSSTALMYLIASLNRHLPQLAVLTLESRVEYVDETELEFIAQALREGRFTPPTLRDVARATLHAEGKPVSVFLGLSDEHLACAGSSFLRPGEEELVALLEQFNRTQDYDLVRRVAEK